MTFVFFYGTLMHPKILKRIRTMRDLPFHLIDFPAILPCERSRVLLGRELTSKENCYYDRLQVLVHPLGPFAPVPVDTTTSGDVEDNLILVGPPPLPAASELAQAVLAQTYVWCLKDNYLNKELWSFDEFIRKNAWKWIKHGADQQGNEDRDS
ncbi:hypothetical protein EDB92DRAFT_1814656 [Lactarius akahatsu]|uniref:Uncharacterized protein n=1 Tax=Lactarius akahatsu TaxID=416441 RepID=A0AAD4LQC5_9AGAM|nr:hypothetical protein EDB92DRAFT_1814656 [Lactarius akahatsu]